MNSVSRNTVKDDVEPQYKFDVESNAVWVDTVYWTFQADLQMMNVAHRICSKYIKFSYIPDTFYLQIEKVSPNQFTVELIRELEDQVPESGHFFQVSFSLVASPCARKVTYMDYNVDNAPVYFTLDEFQASYDPNDKWMIKCAFWMREYTNLDNDRSKVQECVWQAKLKEVAPGLRQCDQMAYIIGRRTLQNLFTGRQDFKFADLKSTLLIRSFRYSDKLLADIARLQNQQDGASAESRESVEDLGKLLGYIRTGQERCISNDDCILLYASAYYCGLSYLKLHCSNYLKMILTDVDIFINVLFVSDMLNDENLRDFALDWFLKNKRKVLTSAPWKNFRNSNFELARGFILLFRKWEADQRDGELQHVNRFARIQYNA